MSLKLPVYLDHNATTPVDPRVLQEMLPYFTEKFGNAASRIHAYGWEAEEGVDMARENVAALIGARPNEIVFTSGATEAVNLALKGIYESLQPGAHIITVATEHKAVLDTCRKLEKMGAVVTYLPVLPSGLIDLHVLEQAITPRTVLLSVMYANNETAVIQPIREIAALAHKHGLLFFTDATQAAGKIPIDVHADGIDLLAMSAHKMYGPKGIGALYVGKKVHHTPVIAQIDGGGHERSMRSGTLNVPGIVGMGKAAEICMEEMNAESKRLAALRDHFEEQLLAIEGSRINGKDAPRLAHATNMSFENINGEKLIFAAGSDLAFSRSSACSSVTLEPSHVLRALGLSDELVHNSFRFSFGRFSTEEQATYAINIISRLVKEHRDERNIGYHKIL
ncbi:cysteine desulfurase family protein [Dyadobacter sandarakinus]|uniref:cysteine desulfurase n=1 Tax=Dyadobacter sandarakinus TaxID=2747268 RepID=A0ABX7I9D3_9BACT|nr:aminotransferase class V-fold PLP-dependent enzyme [Dyadobacter sandarakinus]QRR01581.1 aminotransferase class V-fold PLP-dependent enzyme [Dyadobacter sandarakinus]